WLPGLGFAQAATAMVGQNLGARLPRKAKRVGYQSSLVAIIFMTVLGVSYLVVPELWVRLFTSDAKVIKLGVIYCYVTAFSQPPLAAAMVLSGALRGAGNTRFVMGTTVVGAWCVRLPFAYITGILLGGGILWVWIAMILDWVVRAGALLWRYRREKSFLS
ncbi:MAG: MATE family efflux transporter, partial [candidate division Zixibacteria bacterium]|nr:MATE family efflux transporter [candidate division Zixibacteria bacterium]